MKIQFCEGEWHESMGYYLLIAMTIDDGGEWHRFPLASGLCTKHGDGRHEILVAKQKNFLKTMYIFLHELGHWLLGLFGVQKSKKYELFCWKLNGILDRIFSWSPADPGTTAVSVVSEKSA